MSKTEELRAIVQLMVANYLAAEDYASLCDNYRILVHEQKIMKRPPKDFLNGDWLKNEVKNYVLEQSCSGVGTRNSTCYMKTARSTELPKQ